MSAELADGYFYEADLDRFDMFFEERDGWEHDEGFLDCLSTWNYRGSFADRDQLGPNAEKHYDLSAEVSTEHPGKFAFSAPRAGEELWDCPKHGQAHDGVLISLDLPAHEIVRAIERAEKQAREVTVREFVECLFFDNCSERPDR